MSVLYRFGRAEVRPAERELLIDGAPAALGARAFDVLLALIERRERCVTKNELLERVWPGRVVEENNLQVQISALRKLLGHETIGTIPGRGYRFAVPLCGASQVPSSAMPPGTQAVSAAQRPCGTNLPAESPRLYGRDVEVGEVLDLLARRRFVSVVGAGGIGKTRLAQTVASRMRGRFDDGVWLIELAALSDPARVAGTVAHVLNMTVGGQANATDAVVDAVRGKVQMLVFDNCEHVLAAVAGLVAAIRRNAPGVTLLATSQEPLRVADEQIYRLGTLAVPLPDLAPTADVAAEFGAVALFVARAGEADPRFTLNARTVGAVLEICRRLDGIALALELAAARVPLLGVEGVRARLDERFKLLSAGTRNALPRYQTLRAALQWGHALLSDEERKVFRRLGVFVGGFALEAAQRVARDAGMDAWEVLDHLGRLVDKSLVVAEQGDPPRYRLLESARAFALERLAEAGETEAIARCHAQAIVAMFETSFAERWHVRPTDHFARYRPDLDNLRAALEWSDRNDPELEIALVGASAWLWWHCGLHAEGIAVCERGISHISDTTPQPQEARVLSELAHVGYFLVPAARAFEMSGRAIALYRSLNDRVGEYLALAQRAPYCAATGDADEARRVLAQVELLEDPAWPPRLRLQRVWALTGVLWFTGPVEELRAVQEERCRIARLAGNELDELAGLRNLVALDVLLGHYDAAIRDGRQLVGQFRRRGFALHLGYLLATIAWALAMRGTLDEALHVLREAVPVLRHDTAVFTVLDVFALTALLRGRADNAARLAGAADAVVNHFGYRRLMLGQHQHETIAELLNRALAPNERARLMHEGAAMSEKDVMALALNEIESADN